MHSDVKTPFAKAALAMPLVGFIAALFLALGKSQGPGGDMVGWAFFVYAGISLGASAVLGLIAAIISYVRREPSEQARFYALLLNVLFLIPGACSAKMFY